MNKVTLCLTALLVAGLAGCVSDDNPTGVICTNFGAIEIKLFDDKAPITTQNFIDLAESGYYDGVVFHRIITDFMMQGGDPEGTGRGGEAFGGGTIPDEFDPSLRHDRGGLLSMANAGPNTGSSQFFITFVPTPHLDDKHTIFGEVTGGMDVVEAIETEAASRSGTPMTDVFMQTVLIGKGASACPAAEGIPEPVPAFACPTSAARTATTPIDADVITPGLLCITNQSDVSLVWARNFGTTDTAIEWSLTGKDGAALPEGWNVTFDAPAATVGAYKGSKETAHTLMHVDVPADANGSYELELHTSASTTAITAHVDLRHDELTAKGDTASIHYDGSCNKDGKRFQEGDFSTPLGSGQTVTGFDLGLLGMGESETATISIPAPMAYGYSAGPCAGDNADLSFIVTITKL